MEFSVLGPLEVRDDGRTVEIRSGKQRTLLALLLLEANRVVSSDRLVDALWGDAPPETAAKALHVHVSQLRKLVGRDRLQTRPSGYALAVGEGEFDRDRFEELVQEGRPRDALGLWRGPALAEFAREPFAQGEAARLEELRVACREDVAETGLAAGRHAELVADLEALAAEHPLRERLRGQLMLALYRSGRQAEALDAYRDLRRALVGELGIEPGRALRELQQAILRQDPSLDPPAGGRAEPDAARGVFVGREAELAELLACLDDAFAGRGRLALLSGEPGIGKSRLAEELLVRARARGAEVLVGRCWEAGGAPPYWPWVQSLRAHVRETDPGSLREQLGAGAAVLAQIVPEIRDALGDVAGLVPLDPEAARFRLFDATVETLRAAAARRPLVLVVDDLHAADTPSLLLLQFAARELASSRLLVVGAFRDVDPVPGPALTGFLAEVAREPVTRRIPLAGLGERDVAELLERTASELASPELAAALYEQTEGNPLFVAEATRLLSAEGVRARSAAEALLAVPQSVRDVIARRLDHLSEECRRVLVLASVLGRELDVESLAATAGAAGDDLLETLDEAMTARLLTDVPGARGRVRFAHVLIRDSLYDGLTTARRVRLHRVVVEALERLQRDAPGRRLAELAHHALAGSDFERALGYARAAGDDSIAKLAYEEAARLYEAALDALDLVAKPDEAERCDLLLALGDAQTLAGDGHTARRTFVRAAAHAKAIGSPERLTRATLGYTGRGLWGPRAEGDTNVVPLLEDALAFCRGGDPVLRSRLLARLASSLRGAVDRERPRALAAEAVELAAATGDPESLLYALGSRVAATRGPDTLLQAGADGAEIVRLARELRQSEYEFSGHENLLYVASTLGDPEGAARALDEMARLADELRQPAKRWAVASYRAMSALAQGRLDEAEELVEAAYRVGETAESWIAVASHRLQTFALRELRGDLEGYDEVLRRTVGEYPGYRIVECALARTTSLLGREDEAREIYERLAADDFGALSRDEDWLVNMSLLAEVCVALADTERAAALHRLLEPFARSIAFAQAELDRGAVARTLGCLAAMLGRFDDAGRDFDTAVAINENTGHGPWLAQTLEDHARLLVASGSPDDVERAGLLDERALASYRAFGMHSRAARLAARPVRRTEGGRAAGRAVANS